MDNVLEIKDMDLYVPDGDGIRKVVSGFSLIVRRGEIKRIEAKDLEEADHLYRIISGEKEPTAGSIYRAKGKIGKISRGSQPFLELMVYENIALALAGRYSKGTAREHGFDPRQTTSELNSAERTRLHFLQRYLQKPIYIVAEEPFRGLDNSAESKVMDSIREETQRGGISVIIIETAGEKKV